MAKKNKQLQMGALLSYCSIALNFVAGLLYTPWMIEQIGQADYGLYTLANSLITLFIVDFGLGTAVSRYVSKYRAEGRQEEVDNFLGVIYKLYVVIDAVILLILTVVFFLIEDIYVKLTPAEIEKFKIVYIMAASFAVVNFPFVTLNGILNSYEKFIQLKLADIIYRVSLVAVTIVALYLGYGLYALVGTHVIIGLLVIVYKLIVVGKYTPVHVNWRHRGGGLLRELVRFSLWITIATLAQRLIFNITPSILGVVADSAAIAVFGVITTIEGYVFTVSTAINGMFLPRIAKITTEDQSKEKLNALLLTVGKFQYIITGLIVAGFVVVGREFIELWVGPEYRDAYIGIVLVIVPGLFYNSLQIAHTTLIVENKVKIRAGVELMTGILNVILSFILSYRFGAIGAAIAIFTAYTVRILVLLFVYRKVLHIDIWQFITKCYLRMSIPIGICIAVGWGLNAAWHTDRWIPLVAKGMVIVVVYVVAMFLIGLSRQDRSTLLARFKKTKPSGEETK